MNAPLPLGAEMWLLLLLLGFWCAIIALVSALGGWHRLARMFPAEQTSFRISDPDAARYYFASMSMGPPYFPTNYGSCLTIAVGNAGIELRVALPFRFLHPPLLIPWNAIECCERDRYLWCFQCTRLQLISVPHPLCIYGRAAQDIYDRWKLLERSRFDSDLPELGDHLN